MLAFRVYNLLVVKIKVIGTIFTIATLLIAGTAVVANAQNGNNGQKPGWGFGDKNHVHTGPPGLSVSVHPTGSSH